MDQTQALAEVVALRADQMADILVEQKIASTCAPPRRAASSAASSLMLMALDSSCMTLRVETGSHHFHLDVAPDVREVFDENVGGCQQRRAANHRPDAQASR